MTVEFAHADDGPGSGPPELCIHCGYDELNCMCDDEDFMDSLDCTYCGGDGLCDDGADPLWSCPPEIR